MAQQLWGPQMWVGDSENPGSLQENPSLSLGTQRPGTTGIDTVAWAAVQTTQNFTRDFGFQCRERFLCWRKKKEAEEIDWAPGVMGRVCGY